MAPPSAHELAAIEQSQLDWAELQGATVIHDQELGAVLIHHTDPGPGFNIDNLPHAAISHPDSPTAHMDVRDAKGLRAGGYGLLTVQSSVDELLYNEKRNEVVFVK